MGSSTLVSGSYIIIIIILYVPKIFLSTSIETDRHISLSLFSFFLYSSTTKYLSSLGYLVGFVITNIQQRKTAEFTQNHTTTNPNLINNNCVLKKVMNIPLVSCNTKKSMQKKEKLLTYITPFPDINFKESLFRLMILDDDELESGFKKESFAFFIPKQHKNRPKHL